MPELPEVEIVKQSLIKSILSKKIDKVLINNRNLRYKIPNNFKRILENKKILKIFRKSKYLVLSLNNDFFVTIHLGMSGTLHLIKNGNKKNTNLSFYQSKNLPIKHNHIHLIFKKIKIIYNDPRRFGYFKLIKGKVNLLNFFQRIGPEPFDKEFNYDYLKKKLYTKQKNIKNFLLDQKIVSGIGNIYANEILFYCMIHPLKKCKSLNTKDIKNILKISKFVLKKAIKNGGSSIRDFQNISGSKGNFQKEFKVYDRMNLECFKKNCKGKINKIMITNRSSFFCNICQK